ncbi:MAG: hypothetical protein JSS27_08235 [Planctomycetes bacterium]|nr:hypothetical protein [Planctomycetota bacterium]
MAKQTPAGRQNKTLLKVIDKYNADPSEPGNGGHRQRLAGVFDGRVKRGSARVGGMSRPIDARPSSAVSRRGKF